MRYIVISDIHGNWAALEAAVKMLPSLSPDGILFLGDYITDGADPQRIIRTLHQIECVYPCTFILGNREEYFLKNRLNPDPTWQPCSHTGSLWYTAKHLTEEDLEWFAQMPISKVICPHDAPDFMICHGSPVAANDRMLGSKNKEHREEMIRSIDQNLLICGHSHRQEIYYIDNKRVIFCPSLGLPLMRNGTIPSQHMLQLDLTDGCWECSFLSVNYNIEAYVRDMLASPFASASKVWCRGIAQTLRTQQNVIVDCLVLAHKLAAEDGCTAVVPLPEIYWEKAAAQLGI